MSKSKCLVQWLCILILHRTQQPCSTVNAELLHALKSVTLRGRAYDARSSKVTSLAGICIFFFQNNIAYSIYFVIIVNALGVIHDNIV